MSLVKNACASSSSWQNLASMPILLAFAMHLVSYAPAAAQGDGDNDGDFPRWAIALIIAIIFFMVIVITLAGYRFGFLKFGDSVAKESPVQEMEDAPEEGVAL